MRQVVKDDGKIRLIFKDWPVLGPASVSAAKMVLAAKYQDKYIQAHEALITATSRLTDDIVRERLAAAGIDVERATRDLDTNKAKINEILARNNEQAKAFGFRGTPAFIIGKFRVNSPLIDDPVRTRRARCSQGSFDGEKNLITKWRHAVA